MTSVNPVEIKKLGNKVKNSAGFKKAGSEKWREVSIEVMKRALEAKFVQNKVLADRLIKTTNYVLIEANKDDQFWAVGLPVKHASLKNPEAWKGKNMLGQLLMELRERLKQNIDANNENMEIEESPENVEKQVEPEIVQGDAEIEVNEEEQKDNESVHSDHESSDNIWSQFKRNHFFVSQIVVDEGIICHRITDSENDDPWIVQIPQELCKDEVLHISDIVEINEFGDRRPRFQELTSINWFHEDARKINWQCVAKEFCTVYKKKLTDEPAIVVGKQRTYWEVCSVGLNQKNRVYKYMFPDSEQFMSLSVGKIIEVNVVDLWPGSQVGENYVLPIHTPFKRLHRPVDGETKWVVAGQRIAEYEDWTWPPPRATRPFIQTYEQLMGAAVLASKVFENQLCSGGKIITKLHWVPNEQGISTTACFDLLGEISKNITRVWREDSLVTVKGQRTFATAWISEMTNANNSLRVTLEFSWESQPKGSQDIKDEGRVEIRVSTYNLPANIRQRLFQNLSITRAIDSNSSQGKILAELIGISPGMLGDPKEQYKILNSNLNARQNDTAALCLDPETTGLIIQEAPPGTGKSQTIADIAIESLKRKVVTRMAILAPSNQALESLILKFMPKLSEVSSDINSSYERSGQICLLLVSDAAKTKYKQMFQRYKKVLLIQAINDYQRQGGFKDLEEPEINILNQYRQKMKYKHRNPNEKRAAEVMRGKIHPSHPALVKPLSEAFYNGDLVSGLLDTDRQLLKECSWFPGGVPLLLIDCKGYEVPYMGSYSNPAHTNMALHIFYLLAKTAPPSKITILNYYRGQARDISDKMEQQYRGNVKCVDGYQGEESDIVILNKGGQEAIFESQSHPGISYRFVSDGNRNRYYCGNCCSVNKTRVRVVIKDDCFSRNPDELAHVCRENAHSSQHAISNRKVLNAEKRAAETSPAITSHIYKKVARKCEEQFDNPEDRHKAVLALQSQSKIARTVRLHTAKGKTKVLNVRQIPAELKQYDKPWPQDLIQLRPGASKENFFLLFEELRPAHDPLLIFADMQGLWTLHQSRHISLDGTFKYVPHSPHPFCQVYTIHSVHQQLPDRSQATLSAFALMTKKDSQAYAKLFDEISSTLFVLFGSTGCEKVWHFDHELAAITSCQEEFKDKVTSCYFHFTKNCLTRAANLGLNQRLKKDPALRKWLRTLIGGVHLKLAHQQALWDYLLQHPPQIREYAAIASFVLYFQGQWNTEASRQLLNQYENDGPRTTNFSEVNRNQFGSLHPGLGEFLQSMQKELYRQSVESERLLRGQPIRLRRRKYREAEAKLAEVRQEYRAVLEANILLEEHIEQDEIQTVLIPSPARWLSAARRSLTLKLFSSVRRLKKNCNRVKKFGKHQTKKISKQ
ncbi:AAA domain-containing protein [Ditylenchus destructor]|uniref:AAA domain-containing protein n=1 Tax=Ditylenchus destructor TaxID=166010 RepID=A0AAD4QZ07_9BILA|nr:AAA domain-containing protein [Ditylenchus destructor]